VLCLDKGLCTLFIRQRHQQQRQQNPLDQRGQWCPARRCSLHECSRRCLGEELRSHPWRRVKKRRQRRFPDRQRCNRLCPDRKRQQRRFPDRKRCCRLSLDRLRQGRCPDRKRCCRLCLDRLRQQRRCPDSPSRHGRTTQHRCTAPKRVTRDLLENVRGSLRDNRSTRGLRI